MFNLPWIQGQLTSQSQQSKAQLRLADQITLRNSDHNINRTYEGNSLHTKEEHVAKEGTRQKNVCIFGKALKVFQCKDPLTFFAYILNIDIVFVPQPNKTHESAVQCLKQFA